MDGPKVPAGAYSCAPKPPSAAFAVPVALDRSFGIASCALALMLLLTEHTSFAMDWPPNCCVRAPRSGRSASYWVTTVRKTTTPAVHLSGPCARRRHAVVFGGLARAHARGDATAATVLGGSAMSTPISLAALLERFFTQRLMQQRQASPHTISSYRDTFHQFLKFTEQRLRKEPSRLNFQEIDAPLITAFLDHLEKHQGLSTRSRNLRLTALRSFFRFAAFEVPTHSA